MSDEASDRCMKCLRWLVFGFNLFFWLAGLGTLGIGLWLRFDPDVANYISQNGDLDSYYTGVYILIAVGVVMALLGFSGCCGALRESQCLLVFFFLILVLVFTAELIGAILAFKHQDKVKSYIETSMYDAVYSKYHANYPYTTMVDKMQKSLECCGVHSYQDWLHSFYSTQSRLNKKELGISATSFGIVPPSCCNADGVYAYPDKVVHGENGEEVQTCGSSFNQAPLITYSHYIHDKGCSDAFYEKIYSNLNCVIVIAVVIGSLQLLGMVLSMTLCCFINVQKEEDRKTGGYY